MLAFPCNQFGFQEPGTNEEIAAFANNYSPLFDVFAKTSVNGSQTEPVFAFLKSQLPGSFGQFIKWNFTKFLVDAQGRPVKRFSPKDDPLKMEADILALLDQPLDDRLGTATDGMGAERMPRRNSEAKVQGGLMPAL